MKGMFLIFCNNYQLCSSFCDCGTTIVCRGFAEYEPQLWTCCSRSGRAIHQAKANKYVSYLQKRSIRDPPIRPIHIYLLRCYDRALKFIFLVNNNENFSVIIK